MSALADELRDDPLRLGYAALISAGDTAGIAELITQTTADAPGSVSRAWFAMWAGRTGLRGRIEDAAADKGSPLRSIALTLLDFLRGGVAESLDLANQANVEMLDAWEMAGAITADQRTQLTERCTRRVSRAEQIGLSYVSASDVAAVMFADDGERLL